MAIQQAPAPAGGAARRAVHFPPPPPALPLPYGVAVDRYLAAARLAKSSAWIHRIALTTWGWLFTGRPAPVGPARRATLPEPFPLAALGAHGLAPVLAELAAQRTEALDTDTVRRELAIVRRAVGWWLGRRWLAFDPTVGIERRPAPADPTRPLASEQVAALWRLGAPVRERVLWRLLHESGARADDVLTLNVEHVNAAGRCGTIVARGGAIQRVAWRSGTAELLPELVAGRTRGPLFLSGHATVGWSPERDRCPVTGRTRLSYRRAEELFERHTRLLANPLAGPADLDALEGWRPLHRLRPSAYSPFALGFGPYALA